jgi:hypothetical protein
MRDLGTAEEILRATSLDWTIVRPPRLMNRTDERYIARPDALPDGSLRMSIRPSPLSCSMR